MQQLSGCTTSFGGGDFTLYMQFFFEKCQLQNFNAKNYDSKRWKIPKTSSLVTVGVDCMVFGTVGRRLTEIWNCMFIGITSCEQKHHEGNVAEDVYIARACRVSAEWGVSGRNFSISWLEWPAVAVSPCCCCEWPAVAACLRAVAESAQRDLERVICSLKSNKR